MNGELSWNETAVSCAVKNAHPAAFPAGKPLRITKRAMPGDLKGGFF